MVKRGVLLLTSITLFVLFFAFPVHAQSSNVLILNIKGVINPFTARYLERGLLVAEQKNAALVVLTLDTPGGLETSMREMVQLILSSSIPVAVYVVPSGARAASAGLFILMAADFAVMAPATNIGAATPVGMGQELDEVMSKKATSDAAALIRSLAQKHQRNGELVELAVYEGISLTADEALSGGVIDFIAGDLLELVDQLDGRTAK